MTAVAQVSRLITFGNKFDVWKFVLRILGSGDVVLIWRYIRSKPVLRTSP